jgi:hypothetical protein
MPPEINDDSVIKSFSDLKQFGERNGFDVVNYDEFWASISENDRKTAPPRSGVPFFALYHNERGKPMFVLVEEIFLKFSVNFKEIVLDVIGHEMIHAQQVLRKGNIDYHLPSPLELNKYFSNKEEIMAFSYTIAKDLSRKSKNIKDAISKIRTGMAGSLWKTIKATCNQKTIDRYKKYIYLYLEEIFKNKS